MNVEGKRLPLAPDATSVDIWKLDNGIGLTIANEDGQIAAGVWLSRTQWTHINNFIQDRFRE
jgi:hypothetical protein